MSAHTPGPWGNDLSDAQRAALHRLLVARPRDWKATLRSMWSHPGVWQGKESFETLYSIRNTHGPSWLAKMTATKIAAIAKAEGRS